MNLISQVLEKSVSMMESFQSVEEVNKQTKPNKPTKPNQTKPNQIKSNQTRQRAWYRIITQGNMQVCREKPTSKRLSMIESESRGEDLRILFLKNKDEQMMDENRGAYGFLDCCLQ